MGNTQRADAERVVIELKTKMAVLILQPFDGDIDTEHLLQIDYFNLLGEILTFPVIYNRIAVMKAEMANILAHAKIDLEIFEANLYKEKKTKLEALTTSSRGPSIKDVETEIAIDPRYKVKKGALADLQRNFDYLDALYWAAQSKDTKLRTLSERIKPEEFEKDILEGSINGVMIKTTRKSIQ